MATLFIATTNLHKLAEIRRLLSGSDHQLVSLADQPLVEEPEETGATFEENARLKALYYDAQLGHHVRRTHGRAVLTVAEDSGLVVDALDGEPGVRSARFVRPDASYPERFDEIYRRLAERPSAPRAARFVAALAVAREGHIVFETTGTVEGEIAAAPSGVAGFGYDPIFFYPPFGQTLADVEAGEKLGVAHRGTAFRALAAWLGHR